MKIKNKNKILYKYLSRQKNVFEESQSMISKQLNTIRLNGLLSEL